jgi:flagellar biosynthesis/type III secretory pathway M-ring protein FliF/YscJ
VDSILYGVGIIIADCLYSNDKLGGNMEKLKTMWKDLSKTGKIVLAIVVVAAVVVAYNAII